MKKVIIDTTAKTITILTDFDFIDFNVDKPFQYFHFNFQKTKNEDIRFALFYKDFGGKKYYPKEIIKLETFKAEKRVEIEYSN